MFLSMQFSRSVREAIVLVSGGQYITARYAFLSLDDVEIEVSAFHHCVLIGVLTDCKSVLVDDCSSTASFVGFGHGEGFVIWRATC